MSSTPATPGPIPRWQVPPTGSAGARPAGPAGTAPVGAAGTHPRMRRTVPTATTTAHRKRLATAFVELFLEVEAGCRPARHLAPLLAPMLYARLTRVWYRGGRPGRVVSVSVIGEETDAFDVIAVVQRGARSGAVSLRIAAGAGRWRIEELARPEDGALPGPAYRVALNDDGEDEDAEIPVVLLREPPAEPRAADTRGGGAAPATADPDWFAPVPTG